MARLFITPREVDFISDLTKELTKDVRGQKIYYYGVREDLTDVHDVYEEAREKVFNPPIEIEASVEWQPSKIATNRYGSEETYTISTYLHSRDLLDRDIVVKVGDYFSYGTEFYEITSALTEKQVYGQIEHNVGVKVTGVQARRGVIDNAANGPSSEEDADADAVQSEFVQQRGYAENKLGETADKRQLVDDGKLDPGLTGPKEVTKQGIEPTSFFYGDE
jgi:hypothetical protein